MNVMYRITRLAVFAFAIVLAIGSAYAENGPSAVIETFHHTLLDVMKNAEALGVQGRFERLETPLRHTFDFERMIAFASGSLWNSASEEERTQLVDAFSRASIATYASQFDGYTNEGFEILGEREGPRGSALVDTQITRDPEPPVAITYVMKQIDDEWRVIDILLEKKVSEMARRRSEYNKIVRQGGSPALIRAMNDQADKLLSNPA